MSLILHIVIIASYFVLATAVALVAPALVPSLTADLAPLAARGAGRPPPSLDTSRPSLPY